jgi:hypothetical protein
MIMRTTHLTCSSPVSGSTAVLLAALLAGIYASPLLSQAPAPAASPAPAAKAAAPAATTYQPERFPKRERSYYQLFWGVDSIHVKAVESGELIKFSYRVLDADKAKPLNDKNNEPAMYVPALRAKLVVPTMEKVGQLRQTASPEPGRSYWMTFSNPGAIVKRGERVSVVIGQFHVDGLIVE